jgi:hypothetical protein
MTEIGSGLLWSQHDPERIKSFFSTVATTEERRALLLKALQSWEYS